MRRGDRKHDEKAGDTEECIECEMGIAMSLVVVGVAWIKIRSDGVHGEA